MGDRISDEIIEYVAALAELELSGEEREQAREDLGRMLDYIDMLDELDTEGTEPMPHIFPVRNVFREDVAANQDEGGKMLQNAPLRRDDMFVVPKTFR